MRYLALATDYDDTLTTSGQMEQEVTAALERLRVSGRRVVLLTGRTLEQLTSVAPPLELFDLIVLENGAVLHAPSTRQTTVLCPPPRPELVRALSERMADGTVVWGQVIASTKRPNEIAVLEIIRDLGLELQITFNGPAVMVLPSGVNKGTGLDAALRELGFSAHEVVGVGSGENDHSFLARCECAVAVANAVPALKARADFSTRGAAGSGVAELIDELVDTDLSVRTPGGTGDAIPLATRHDGTAAMFPAYGHNILVCGPSGAGKSTFATGLIERLMARQYQLCIIDPEGDFGTLDEIVTVGNRLQAAMVDEVLERLKHAATNVVVNLLGVPLRDRPDFFSQLFPGLQAMRARTGRPHWMLLDEVHHLLPALWGLARATLPQRLGETILITYRPREVAPAILRMIDTAVAVGPSPEGTLADLAKTLGEALAPPLAGPGRAGQGIGEVLVWQRTAAAAPFPALVIPPRSQRLRHLRKYAEGNLGPKSFFFRGPAARMNLRAQNLVTFCDIAAGIDDETWSHHLRKGDYSTWMRRVIKDEELAREVASVEHAHELGALDSRRIILEAIDRRYMLPN